MTAIIVMATYNAGSYLKPQLGSLQAQSFEDWQLLVSDDGSVDRTAEILRDTCRQDSRCRLLPPRAGAAGPSQNFEYLLEAAAREATPGAPIFLCDQDDVWEPHKLALQRELLVSVSGCYSDAALIDSAGVRQAGTLLTLLSAPLDPDVSSLLAQNSVLGCSLAIRAEVLRLALPFPAGLVNHDWWLALCALSLDGLLRSDELLLNYRQHDHNEIGSYRPYRQWQKLPALLNRQSRVLAGQRSAAQQLAKRLGEQGLMVPDALDDYAVVLGKRPVARSFALLTGHYAATHRPLRWLRAMAALRL